MTVESPPRLLILVRHRGNAKRLQEWGVAALGAEPVVVAPEDETIDLVVADAAAFAAEQATIAEVRAAQESVDVPLLLVCTPREAERLPAEMWRRADDVVITPIRQQELRVRAERLLEQRRRAVAREAERAELRRSNLDLERFAFVAAHELVAPLAAVTGAVHTLTSHFVSDGENAESMSSIAIDGCQRMQSLIRDILDLSRAGQGETAELVSTQRLVGEVCADLGVTVVYDELPDVVADPSQLRLVFRNLIANALKFARPEVPARIQIDVAREDDRWRFCVADNGIGIESRDRERVFDLFARVGAQTTVGSGIGLALCRRIVEGLGGRIWIEPRDGFGTAICFTVAA